MMNYELKKQAAQQPPKQSAERRTLLRHNVFERSEADWGAIYDHFLPQIDSPQVAKGASFVPQRAFCYFLPR